MVFGRVCFYTSLLNYILSILNVCPVRERSYLYGKVAEKHFKYIRGCADVPPQETAVLGEPFRPGPPSDFQFRDETLGGPARKTASGKGSAGRGFATCATLRAMLDGSSPLPVLSPPCRVTSATSLLSKTTAT